MQSPTSLRIITSLVLLGLAACHSQDDSPEMSISPQRTQNQAIKGGQIDESTKAIVGMFLISGRSGGVCSGTLIAPNLVLTAQHCIAQVASEQVICGRSGFGAKFSASNILISPETYMPQNPRAYFAGVEIHTPPGGNDMCGFDIALVILKDNVPASQATPIMPRLNTPPQPGERYSSHGYGHTGNGQGTGVRRVITGRQVQCVGTRCGSPSIVDKEFVGTEGTCQGDSGGGAIDAQGRVIGALSRGPDGCVASVYSSPASWSTWMREIGAKAAQRGGYQPAEWVVEGSRDTDGDTITDLVDNCPNVSNPDQSDVDKDSLGDACDLDNDNDGIEDAQDNCPTIVNPDQKDGDQDGDGDLCDGDHDNDGIPTEDDNCPYVSNADQLDSDLDRVGDACDADDDGDGVDDLVDNCPFKPNADQANVCPDGDLPTTEVSEDPLILSNNQKVDDSCSSAPVGAPSSAPLWLGLFGIGFAMRRRKR